MEGTRFQTGNDRVDRLSRMNITGNIIPSAWYQTIRKGTGKPYLNAIVILSDIVYWYRAAEVRDEGSGRLLGYRKRFKADLLQRSYQQMADQFGITKRDATNAVVELERLGVVKRVFRTLTIGGQLVPNILFLDLDVEVLERLTFPEEYPAVEGEGAADEPVEPKKPVELIVPIAPIEFVENRTDIEKESSTGEPCGGYHRNRGHLPPGAERGITEIGDTPLRSGGDGPTQTGETNTEITYRDYNRDYPIQSYQQVKEAFKEQIDYEQLLHDRMGGKELDELVEIAVEVLTSKLETIRVNREERPASVVKEQYRKLNMFHIQYALDCLNGMETKARNIRAVMVTTLYNAAATIGSYYGNLYQYHRGMGESGG